MNTYLKRNHWESAFFGREILSVQFGKSESEDEPIAGNALRQAKVATSNFEQLLWLQQQGFQLVETELLFRLPLNPLGAKSEALDLNCQSAVTTLAEPREIAVLQAEFGLAFAHSRFRPPYFSVEEAQRFYQKWIETAVKGEFDDACWLEKSENGTAKGLVSLRVEEESAYIGLLAVATDFQRQGVAKRLIQLAQQQAKKQGANQLFIRTQLSNLAAVAFYQSIDAELIESYYWLYR